MSSKHFSRATPTSKSTFITEVLESLRKRRKSLKHKCSKIECDRVYVEEEGERFEKLEISLSPGHSSSPSCILHIGVWEDRWIQLSFSEWKGKGWDWSWSYEGKILPTFSGKVIINTIESTLMYSHEMSSNLVTEFDSLWMPLIARKPELIQAGIGSTCTGYASKN